MLNAIIRASLRYRGLVLLLAAVALGYGGHLATTLPIDVFPDLDRPRVVLLAECPGLSTEEVETLVTQPLETAVLGAQGVEAVRSQSTGGFAVVYVEFDWRTDVRSARQVVTERLAAVAGVMPPGVKPVMTPPTSIMGQIMHVGFYRDTPSADPARDNRELRSLADWAIRPRLLQEPGVAEVLVMGGDRKQYQVLLDPAKLLEHGVTLKEAEQAVRESNLAAAGGFTVEPDTERAIRVMARLGPDPAKVLADLRLVPVKATGPRPVLLAQVAEVREGAEPKRGDGGVDGFPAVVLTIVKQPHADTRRLTERLETVLADLQKTMPPGHVIRTDLFKLRTFIDRGLYYVGEALLLGAGLVVAVLFAFLLNLRTTFITLTAIPLSLAITAVVFHLVGRVTGTDLSINVMTLGGIAVAMGELVDDAVVDVENIHRRLAENGRRAAPRPALVVVYEASREVRSAVVFGTAVVVLAFVPLFALDGVEGRLFVPLGLAYVVAILASLAVSLTVTPALSYMLLAGRPAATGHADGWLVRGLKWGAAGLVRFSMRWAGGLLVLVWLAVGVAGWKLAALGADFLPKFDEGSVQFDVTLPPGASLEASTQAAAAMDAQLRARQKSPANPDGEVLHWARRTGRAENDEHAEPVNSNEYLVSMNPAAVGRRAAFLKETTAAFQADLPGVDVEAEQPLDHLISHMLSGVKTQISVKITGDDLDVLQRLARQVQGVMAAVPGATKPVVEPQETVDELHVVPRADDLAYYGLTRQYVADFVQTALKGEPVSQVLEGRRRFDLVVKLRDDVRTDYRYLADLRLDLPHGRGQVRLGDVCDFPDGAGGPNQVKRENVRRRAVVRCNVAGRDLAGVATDIEALVAGVPLPVGYAVEVGGQFQAQRSATRRIAVLAGVSVVGIFTVLYLLFPSARIAAQILNAVPAAFVGGVLALLVTGQTVTVASLVGFVSLGGIAVRNGILLVSHYVHLMAEEGEGFTKEMVVRGSLERLSPVLMTALTAGLGLVPLVVGGQKPGLEILYPVATVILGGLVTSTLCEFLLHPGLFWRFSGRDAERLAHPAGPPVQLTTAPFDGVTT